MWEWQKKSCSSRICAKSLHRRNPVKLKSNHLQGWQSSTWLCKFVNNYFHMSNNQCLFFCTGWASRRLAASTTWVTEGCLGGPPTRLFDEPKKHHTVPPMQDLCQIKCQELSIGRDTPDSIGTCPATPSLKIPRILWQRMLDRKAQFLVVPAPVSAIYENCGFIWGPSKAQR